MNFLLLYLSTVCVSYYLLFWLQNYIVLLFILHAVCWLDYAGWWMMIVRLLKPMLLLMIKMMLINDPIPLSKYGDDALTSPCLHLCSALPRF